MTKFPHGISSFGAPILPGAGRSFPGLWTSRVWFVDGINGSDNNRGDNPLKAVKTIAKAISLCGKDDTIYVRPQTVGTRYTENVTITVATQAGLSIIGTGNGYGTSVYQACGWKGVTGTNAPIIIANASYANFENFLFWGVAAQTTGGLILIRWNSAFGAGATATTGLNIGSSISNCTFAEDPDHPDLTNVQRGVMIDSSEGIRIEGCQFKDLPYAINIGSSVSITDAITIRENEFLGTAAGIAADIRCADCSWLTIDGNVFGHAVPALGDTKYISCVGTVSGTVARNFQGENEVAAGTNNSLSNMISAGNFGLGGPWTS